MLKLFSYFNKRRRIKKIKKDLSKMYDEIKADHDHRAEGRGMRNKKPLHIGDKTMSELYDELDELIKIEGLWPDLDTLLRQLYTRQIRRIKIRIRYQSRYLKWSKKLN